MSSTDCSCCQGSLLAIPASSAAAVKTTTVIGAKIKRALVDYGGYIVDGSGRGNAPHPHHNLAAICMDADVNSELRQHYGVSVAYPHGVANPRLDPNGTAAESALYGDLLRVFQALHSVVNNSPESIGGGGAPRVPRKAPICGADAGRAH